MAYPHSLHLDPYFQHITETIHIGTPTQLHPHAGSQHPIAITPETEEDINNIQYTILNTYSIDSE